MSDLYNKALVILPDDTKVTINQLIDVITLRTLTPDKIKWVELMVNAQFENDKVEPIVIKPGFTDYVFRQIIYYGVDAMLGDQRYE